MDSREIGPARIERNQVVNWQKRCEALSHKIVMRNPWCERCGLNKSGVSDHHGIFKTDQRYIANPFLWYDPTIRFCLCDTHHLYDSAAPHVDQEAFERVMIERYPDKIKRLREILNAPVPDGIDPRIIDWEQVYANIEEFGRPSGDEIFEGFA